MIANAKAINDVVRSLENNNEFFFSYRGKYIWSMFRDNEGVFKLWFYPGQESSEQLAQLEGPEFEDIAMVGYNTKELGTKEAIASFAELYAVLSQKVYGMDQVLDDIISDPLLK